MEKLFRVKEVEWILFLKMTSVHNIVVESNFLKGWLNFFSILF